MLFSSLPITQIQHLLSKSSSDFTIPLSQRVDIQQYAEKLSSCAKFVYFSHNEIIEAYTVVYPNVEDHFLYIPLIWVNKSLARRGLASKMLRFLNYYANIIGCTEIRLEVVKDNTPALNLYLNNNFRPIEDRGQKYLMVNIIKSNAMILKGKKVILRPIERGDLDFIREIINDPEMEQTIVGWMWPVSKKDEERWYSNFKNSDSSIRYIIETENDGIVGLTGLANIDWKNGTAKGAGIRVKNGIHANEIAIDAYMTIFRFAFDELRLNRVSTSAFEDNLVSLRFQEKCGCKLEGIMREAIYRNGTFKNLVIMGILAREYREQASKYWE